MLSNLIKTCFVLCFTSTWLLAEPATVQSEFERKVAEANKLRAEREALAKQLADETAARELALQRAEEHRVVLVELVGELKKTLQDKNSALSDIEKRHTQLKQVVEELEAILKQIEKSEIPHPEQAILKRKLTEVKQKLEVLSVEREKLVVQKVLEVQVQKSEEPKKEAPPKKAAPRNEMTPINDAPGLPRVLLIGDSISIGYTLPVRELLKGKANVHRVLTNCGPTKNVTKLSDWLVDKKTGGEKWDVIHFNFGLHDLKHSDEKGTIVAVTETSKRQVSPEDYEKNLREIVGKLKATGAKLIWCSTTPVPKGAKGRVTGDEVLYNEIALKVMKENNIAVDDLYAFALPKLDKIQNKADVHFSTAGSKELATQVVSTIEEALKK